MTFALFIAGLTLLMLSGYLEWKTRKQPGSRPPFRAPFVFSGKIAPFFWGGFVIAEFYWISWPLVILAALISILLTALFAQKIISRDKAPAFVILGFIIGTGLCFFFYS